MSTGTDEFGTPYDQTSFPIAPSAGQSAKPAGSDRCVADQRDDREKKDQATGK